jgi:acyl dehydratase
MDLPRPGDEIPPLGKEPVGKLQLLRYAGASGDDNLIHVDVETARAVGLPDVIAHGMLSMGFLGQLLTDYAGPGAVRRLQVRFARMVRLGDRLTCHGVVTAVAPAADGAQVGLKVWAENQRGERVTEGEAEVWLSL